MNMKWMVAALAVALAVPGAAAAQSLGVAARAGTLGLGAEGALGLGDRFVARGGVGLMPFELNGDIDDIDVTLELPKTWYNVGLDFYLTGVVRLGAGFLFKPDDITLTGEPTTTVDIGGRDFTPDEIGRLVGSFDTGNRAPYVLLGFGKHTASGIGLSLDLGVAFVDEPQVTLRSEGGTFSDQTELRARLDAEAENFEEDLPAYLDIWPILSLGLRFGIGG